MTGNVHPDTVKARVDMLYEKVHNAVYRKLKAEEEESKKQKSRKRRISKV